MGVTRKEMKQTAKTGMRNARPRPVQVTLVYLLLTTGLNFALSGILLALNGGDDYSHMMQNGRDFSMAMHVMGTAGTTAFIFAYVFIGLFSAVVTFGYTGYALRISRGEDVRFGNLLDGFGLAGKVILLYFLTWLFTVLWSLLFVIPGIIAAYRYRMAVFILLDDPECGVLEAIRMSKTMMAGQKMNLFVFDISFFNWYVLYILIAVADMVIKAHSSLPGTVFTVVCSALIGLWVTPYFTTSQAVFYDAVSDGKLSRRGGRPGDEVKF